MNFFNFFKPIPPKIEDKPVILESRIESFGDLKIIYSSSTIDIIQGEKIVRISTSHEVYIHDILNSFNYYFSAVVPFKAGHHRVVDYSTPRYHEVVGFPAFPILFPSFAEPLSTTSQYMQFAKLSEGMTVLDLGSYSGLTSIVFSQAVGPQGRVIAVDADSTNIESLKINLQNYHRHFPHRISVLEGAVWEHADGLEFSSEGNMGSSATSILSGRGEVHKVDSYRLSDICSKFDLKRVDFIKCDIEGAESVIFKDSNFFEMFRPQIIFETHFVNGIETTNECVAILKHYNYSCNKIVQNGVTLPLLECSPL